MISWVVIYLLLIKGIRSAGKASFFTGNYFAISKLFLCYLLFISQVLS